jgi:hypothetical protein
MTLALEVSAGAQFWEPDLRPSVVLIRPLNVSGQCRSQTDGHQDSAMMPLPCAVNLPQVMLQLALGIASITRARSLSPLPNHCEPIFARSQQKLFNAI